MKELISKGSGGATKVKLKRYSYGSLYGRREDFLTENPQGELVKFEDIVSVLTAMISKMKREADYFAGFGEAQGWGIEGAIDDILECFPFLEKPQETK